MKVGFRPPELVVDEEGPMREDIRSEEVDNVHPEVARLATTRERNQHLARCDSEAFFKHVYPTFPNWKPPLPEGIEFVERDQDKKRGS